MPINGIVDFCCSSLLSNALNKTKKKKKAKNIELTKGIHSNEHKLVKELIRAWMFGFNCLSLIVFENWH